VAWSFSEARERKKKGSAEGAEKEEFRKSHLREIEKKKTTEDAMTNQSIPQL